MAVLPKLCLYREQKGIHHSKWITAIRDFLCNASESYNLNWIESHTTIGNPNRLFVKSALPNKKGRYSYIEFYQNSNPSQGNPRYELHQYHPLLFEPEGANENFDTVDLNKYRNGPYDFFSYWSNEEFKYDNSSIGDLYMVNWGLYATISIQCNTFNMLVWRNKGNWFFGTIMNPLVPRIDIYFTLTNFNVNKSATATDNNAIAIENNIYKNFRSLGLMTVGLSKGLDIVGEFFNYPLYFGNPLYSIDAFLIFILGNVVYMCPIAFSKVLFGTTFPFGYEIIIENKKYKIVAYQNLNFAVNYTYEI